jgi:hypothetical protein
VAKNEAILASLPVFPESVLVEKNSGDSQRANGDVGQVTGYNTMWTYHVPASAYNDQILDFYRSRLSSEWTFIERGEDHMTFRRGSALLVIQPNAPRNNFVVEVDHNFE